MIDYSPVPFTPASWLVGPHMQTLGARLLRSDGGVPFRRERVDTPDGDFVDLDYAFPTNQSGRPLVLVLHGLEGSARSKYALELYRALNTVGLAAVGLNFRSCSGVLNRAPRLYHSGDTADLAWVLEILGRRIPGGIRGAVGFSLGGNVLLKFLGEREERAREHLAAAVAVSVPFDLAAGSVHLERPAGRVYAGYLLRKLCRKVRAKSAMLSGLIDVHRAAGARTFRVFDDVATAPLHGFRDADDYYAQSSSAGYVGRVRVPTLLLHSEDDPFLPRGCIPHRAVAGNPFVIPAITSRGGHVGFVAASSPLRPVFWAEHEAARFLSHLLGGE
jgi:uncharacterized protein